MGKCKSDHAIVRCERFRILYIAIQINFFCTFALSLTNVRFHQLWSTI